MKLSNFAQAIEIIAKTDPGGFVNAQHDQFWAGSPEATSTEDAERLKELGWFEDEDSWSCFT